MPRRQYPSHKSGNVVIAGTERIGQRLQEAIARLMRFTDVEAIQLADEEFRRGRLPEKICRTTSSPFQLPVWPRMVFSPSSCRRALNSSSHRCRCASR